MFEHERSTQPGRNFVGGGDLRLVGLCRDGFGGRNGKKGPGERSK